MVLKDYSHRPLQQYPLPLIQRHQILSPQGSGIAKDILKAPGANFIETIAMFLLLSRRERTTLESNCR